jgi:hypothetical protein
MCTYVQKVLVLDSVSNESVREWCELFGVIRVTQRAKEIPRHGQAA